MFIKNNHRFNIQAYLSSFYISEDGIQYPGSRLLDEEFRISQGITEIPDPARGNDATQFTTEIDVDPWIVITDKPQAVIDATFNRNIKYQILEKESSQARATRESILTNNTTILTQIEADIIALRAQFIRDGQGNIIGDEPTI